MNISKDIELFKRGKLLEGLKQCTEAQIVIFKKMYSHLNLNLDIESVVAKMPNEKLDHAISQVDNTIKNNNKKNSIRQK